MGRKKLCLLFMALLIPVAMCAQTKPAQTKPAKKNSTQDAKGLLWIAKLKATSLADMESGLPDKTFGKWFADQARPGVPHYAVKECGAPTAGEQSKGPMCVVASAKVSSVRRLELTFAMMGGERTVQNDKNPAVPQTSFRFLVGSVGPSDPRVRVPTHVLTRLSDLPPLVRRSSQLPASPVRFQ
jgi:hypothetical protein